MEELLKIEAIKRLKARYFRFLDTKQWDEWGQIFAEDAVLSIDIGIPTWGGDRLPKPPVHGRAAIVESVRSTRHDNLTVHHGHMPEIELTSPTTAKGIWAMEDIVESQSVLRRGHGHYHETYELVGDRWYIKTLHLTRLRREETIRTLAKG